MTVLTEDTIGSAVEALETVGYVRIPAFMNGARLDGVRTALKEQLVAHRTAFYPGYTDKRANDPQLFNLQNKDIRFVELLTDPGLERILMKRLNDPWYAGLPADAPNYILGEYIARNSGDALRLHIDSWMPSPGNLTWMIQVVFVVHDRSVEHGCTTIVPGTHRSGEYTNRDYRSPIEVPVKAGDLVIWDSRLWHGARSNVSGQQSWVLVATLQRWWVRQRFDMMRSVPSTIYEQMSPRQKALLGFCCAAPIDEFSGTDSRGGYERLPAKV